MRILALACLLVAIDARADCERVAVWRGGKSVAALCRADAVARGLTVIDLGDDWLPPVLMPGHDGGPDYATTALALAQERFAEAGLDGELASTDRYLELFGVAPTLGVVRARLADEPRHACHSAIDDTPLSIVKYPLSLGATTVRARRNAVRAIQAHLACDGLADITAFQRGTMILPRSVVDTQTRDALLLDSRERDLRAALRVLRERVAAASGLIEDGTAGGGEATVLGRLLVPAATSQPRGYDPLPDAAEDLIGRATEVTAKALGWSDPHSVLAFFEALGDTRHVAVTLPPVPAYHANPNLSVEIERGDAAHRPALIVYARVDDRRIPLVRWPTTIGGWQDQKIDGDIERRWKPSPVGPRIWRDLYVGPSWLPPDSTPDRELVRHGVLAREQLGPSYRAAFGMVAFIHLAEDEMSDQGIRTHATGNLISLENGVSHGCHRLLGYDAVRLADFVIAHHTSWRLGNAPTYYRRVVHAGTHKFPIAIDTLGYRIQLEPPIAVEVR